MRRLPKQNRNIIGVTPNLCPRQEGGPGMTATDARGWTVTRAAAVARRRVTQPAFAAPPIGISGTEHARIAPATPRAGSRDHREPTPRSVDRAVPPEGG